MKVGDDAKMRCVGLGDDSDNDDTFRNQKQTIQTTYDTDDDVFNENLEVCILLSFKLFSLLIFPYSFKYFHRTTSPKCLRKILVVQNH